VLRRRCCWIQLQRLIHFFAGQLIRFAAEEPAGDLQVILRAGVLGQGGELLLILLFDRSGVLIESMSLRLMLVDAANADRQAVGFSVISPSACGRPWFDDPLLARTAEASENASAPPITAHISSFVS